MHLAIDCSSEKKLLYDLLNKYKEFLHRKNTWVTSTMLSQSHRGDYNPE